MYLFLVHQRRHRVPADQTGASLHTRLVTMSQEYPHHHHGRRSDEAYQKQDPLAGDYGETGFAGGGQEYGGGQGYTEQAGGTYNDRPAGYEDRAEMMRKERRGEVEAGLGATAAGAFAHHEDSEAREHPEHERRHKMEEEAAEAAAAGGVGYGVYEHENRKDAKDAQEASNHEEPKKHHGWFH